jgi:3-deoxy-7-phosphoheptulonate synthase
MIVVFQREAAPSELHSALSRLEKLGFLVQQIHDGEKLLYAAVPVSDVHEHGAAKQIRAFGCVEEVLLDGKPYRLVAEGDNIGLQVGDVTFGGNEAIVMAGPCTVESEEQVMQTAEAVSRAGAKVLRGGAYKPSTSPYSFHGMGLPGLEILQTAGRRYGLKVVSEVMDPRKVELVSEYVDILQIGARNMQNYDLLREVGQSRVPVLLKRGMSARIEEWLLSAEYIAAGGNSNIILCERGVRSFDNVTRNVLDLSAVAAVKQMASLPVVVDPSHATGRRDLVPAMSKAALAAGADGLLIEVHPRPDHSVKDGAQSLSTEEFSTLMPELRRVAEAVGRSLGAHIYTR